MANRDKLPTAGAARPYRFLSTITALFVTALITANILAVKPVELGKLVFPAAVVIFPLSYLFGDVLTEVYGYARAREVIWTGFACNLIAVLAIAIAGALPAATFWSEGQNAYRLILGATPRILAASFAAYLVGEFLNAYVLARLKVITGGRWLWSRTIASTLLGQLGDSAVFITAAFGGVWPTDRLGGAVITQWLLKSGYEALATPLTYAVVNFLKRQEVEDYFDRHTDFSPLRLRRLSRASRPEKGVPP